MGKVRKLVNQMNRQHLALFFYCALMTSIVYSPFVLSVSMFALMAIAVFDFSWQDKMRLSLNPNLLNNIRSFIHQPAFLVVTLGFFLVLGSGFMTEDFSYWFERLRIKIPFLLLPFAFISIPHLSKQQYFGLFYFLLIMLGITCIGIGINYLWHFEEINILLKKGQPMPTPRNHIRFSLMLAMGVVTGGYLYFKRFVIRYDWERKVVLGITLFLFFFIHLLSVRSGLFVLYAAIVVLLIQYIYRSKKYKLGLAAIMAIAIIPFLAYLTIPSFKAKVAYVRYDLFMHQKGEGRTYSDSERLTSLKIGMDIGNAHPLLGIGIGNLRREVKDRYYRLYPEMKEAKMPHNQFISIYAGAGLVGLSIFLFAILYPLFYQRNYRDRLFLGFHVIILCSFLVENTIENSLGVGFYIFFLLLGLRYLDGSIN